MFIFSSKMKADKNSILEQYCDCNKKEVENRFVAWVISRFISLV